MRLTLNVLSTFPVKRKTHMQSIRRNHAQGLEKTFHINVTPYANARRGQNHRNNRYRICASISLVSKKMAVLRGNTHSGFLPFLIFM